MRTERVQRVARTIRDGSPMDHYWLFQKARGKLFTRWVAGSFEAFGDGSAIWPPGIVWGAERISVGANVWIGPNTRLNAENGGRISIGDGTGIYGDGAIGAHSTITIGKKVLISRGATIVDHQHRTSDRELAIADQGVDRAAPITIGDGAWIGVGAVILPGVTIGRNAIVGSNAVVNRDIPDHGVGVGVPARVIGAASEGDAGPRPG